MSDPAARIEHRQPVTDAALPPELHPVLARVYRNRGVVETGALDTGLTKFGHDQIGPIKQFLS